MKVEKSFYSITRLSDSSELDKVVEIWLEGSIRAHYFIDALYWQKNAAAMRDTYIPQSETWLFRDETTAVVGFVSLVDNYLASLFVHPQKQGSGIGSSLLTKAKSLRNSLHLAVYTKNENAIRFYRRGGFLVEATRVDPNTQEEELVMVWKKEGP